MESFVLICFTGFVELSLLSNAEIPTSATSVFKPIVSLSPSGEIAVFAKNTSAVVLTGRKSLKSECFKMHYWYYKCSNFWCLSAKWNHINTDGDQPQETYKFLSAITTNYEER